MGQRNKEALDRVLERVRFFEDIGAEFAAKPRKPGGDDLEAVALEAGVCRKCSLSTLRKQAVPGEGDPGARLMFVGEAPGADEDLQGRPFVGRAGQLLDRIIAAMGYQRGQVFIANILKCRPPNNRDPLPEEVQACSPFLLRQVECIRPMVIVALGKPAASFFSGQEAPISVLRGKFLEFQGIHIMPTFHPAYLLRNERSKKDVWEDMKRVMAFLGKT